MAHTHIWRSQPRSLLLVWLFFGMAGGHRFALRSVTVGLCMLVAFALGLCCVIFGGPYLNPEFDTEPLSWSPIGWIWAATGPDAASPQIASFGMVILGLLSLFWLVDGFWMLNTHINQKVEGPSYGVKNFHAGDARLDPALQPKRKPGDPKKKGGLPEGYVLPWRQEGYGGSTPPPWERPDQEQEKS